MNIFEEYEQELIAKAEREMATEKAAWDALPPSERDRIIADREASMSAMADAIAAQGDDDDDDDDDDDAESESA